MEKKKKTWTEPKLTALVRRKPEEGILNACKNESRQGADFGDGSCLVPSCHWLCDSDVGT